MYQTSSVGVVFKGTFIRPAMS